MTLDDLIAYGANVDEGLARCVNNEAFYLKLLNSVRNETGFDTLKQAIDDGRLKDAFEAAHALKGLLGNLSLTPLYEPMVEITEYLRNETQMDYTDLMDEIMTQWEKFLAL